MNIERLRDRVDTTREVLSKTKYYKRIPKPGGGYKYYYTEAAYKQAHNKEKLKTKKQKDGVENKDFSKYVTQDKQKWYIDAEDVMTGEEVGTSMIGEEIQFKDKKGNKYTAIVGDEDSGRDDDVILLEDVKKKSLKTK